MPAYARSRARLMRNRIPERDVLNGKCPPEVTTTIERARALGVRDCHPNPPQTPGRRVTSQFRTPRGGGTAGAAESWPCCRPPHP